MLHCLHCRYELTGLVKGPGDVQCPECGLRTPHVDGEPRVDPDIFVTMGDGMLPYVFTPSMVAASVICSMAAVKTLWFVLAGSAVILGAWFYSAVRVRRSIRVRAFSAGEHDRLSIHVLVMSCFTSVLTTPALALLLFVAVRLLSAVAG